VDLVRGIRDYACCQCEPFFHGENLLKVVTRLAHYTACKHDEAAVGEVGGTWRT